MDVIYSNRTAAALGADLAILTPIGVDGGPFRKRMAPDWRVSLSMVVGSLLFVALLNTSGFPLLADPDTHWHIAIGEWILAHGTVPIVDSHSHTFLGRPWIAKEWLSQILLALAFNMGGWGAVASLCAASIGLTFALLLRILLRDIGPLPATLFTVAAIAMTAAHFFARPHVLAFPFMVIWVAGLVRAVEERRAPDHRQLLGMLLWANLHGGFTLGLLLCGAFALEAVATARDANERRSLFFAWLKFGAAAFGVACITPYGPESMLVTFRIFDLGDALSLIQEWKSPDFQNQPMMELVLLLALCAGFSRGLKLPIVRLIVVIGLLHLFLKHARNAELLALLTPLAIAPILAKQWPSIQPVGLPGSQTLPQRIATLSHPAGLYAMALNLSLAAVFAGGIIKFGGIRPSPDTTPTAALEFAHHAGLKGAVFNDYGFGGALIHAGIPTFIDGRAELFGGQFMKDYAAAVSLRGKSFEAALDRYKIDWTFLATNQAANSLLEHLPDWQRVYRDDTATIFVRRH